MEESYLASAVLLGIDQDKLAKKVVFIKNYHEDKIISMFYELDTTFKEHQSSIGKLEVNLLYDPAFCKKASINYSRPLGHDTNCLKIAIAQYIQENNQGH